MGWRVQERPLAIARLSKAPQQGRKSRENDGREALCRRRRRRARRVRSVAGRSNIPRSSAARCHEGAVRDPARACERPCQGLSGPVPGPCKGACQGPCQGLSRTLLGPVIAWGTPPGPVHGAPLAPHRGSASSSHPRSSSARYHRGVGPIGGPRGLASSTVAPRTRTRKTTPPPPPQHPRGRARVERVRPRRHSTRIAQTGQQPEQGMGALEFGRANDESGQRLQRGPSACR